MQTAIGIICLLVVVGPLAYGALLVSIGLWDCARAACRWLRDFWRDFRGALDDDPARDCKRDARQEK